MNLFYLYRVKSSESKYCKCIYFASGALARKMEKLAIESWKKVGLSPSHAYLLMLVIDDPGMQPGRLAEELQLSPSTITRLIEKLEEKKLVIRTTEGKLTNVYATPKGKDLLPQLKSCVSDFNETAAGILGKEESTRLVQNINKITDKLN
jgi:DNA-binding MarR family transcriptional regulator